MDLYGLTTSFFQNWILEFEKRDLKELKRPHKEPSPEKLYPTMSFSERQFTELESAIEIMKAVRKKLSEKTIHSSVASEIHGLSNQQVYDWTKRGFLEPLEGKYSRRVYSIVEIAWMLVLRQLQELTGVQIVTMEERIESLQKGGILETCLLRDNHSDYKPYYFLSRGIALGLSYTKIPLPENLYTDIKIDIPVIPIVETVVEKAMIPGFTTYSEDNERKFLIDNKPVSLSSELRGFVQNGVFELIASYADRIDKNAGKVIRNASLACKQNPFEELKEVVNGYYTT